MCGAFAMLGLAAVAQESNATLSFNNECIFKSLVDVAGHPFLNLSCPLVSPTKPDHYAALETRVAQLEAIVQTQAAQLAAFIPPPSPSPPVAPPPYVCPPSSPCSQAGSSFQGGCCNRGDHGSFCSGGHCSSQECCDDAALRRGQCASGLATYTHDVNDCSGSRMTHCSCL